MRYLTVVYHYNRIGERIEPGAFSDLELAVYDFLRSKQVIFTYEFMEFNLSKDNPAFTYKPDFLLPQYTHRGRKVVLEPHGIRDNLEDTLGKLAMFRGHYGKYFCLILIVPDDFVDVINYLIKGITPTISYGNKATTKYSSKTSKKLDGSFMLLVLLGSVLGRRVFLLLLSFCLHFAQSLRKPLSQPTYRF